MPLPRPTASTSPFAEVEAVVSQYRNAVISVYAPGERTGGRYNAETDTWEGDAPGAPTSVIASRRARVQQMRNPQENTTLSEWNTKTAFIIEIALLADDPLISKGQFVRVEACENDPTLTSFVFEVQRAVNSSEAALRTIFAISELTPAPAVAA